MSLVRALVAELLPASSAGTTVRGVHFEEADEITHRGRELAT